MSYERLWARLLESLNGWATAREGQPGRIEVTVPRPGGDLRTIELVMTRDEWDQLVTIPFGDFDLAAREVKRSVLALSTEDRFLVYDTYELVASPTPDLPEDPETLRMEALARQDPGERGRWVVLDDEDNVIDELRPPEV